MFGVISISDLFYIFAVTQKMVDGCLTNVCCERIVQVASERIHILLKPHEWPLWHLWPNVTLTLYSVKNEASFHEKLFLKLCPMEYLCPAYTNTILKNNCSLTRK